MSNVKVVIPWRPDPAREPGFHWVCAYYRHRLGEDSVHIELDESTGPFNRSQIINRGVARFPDSTVVISDADCVICDHSLERAVDEVRDKLIIPHGRRCYTTPKQARQLLARDPAAPVRGTMFRKRRAGPAPSGIWVIRAEVFLQNPMNERFIGWGWEDQDYVTRTPHHRYKDGPLFHIWHPPASRAYKELNRILFERIHGAACG